MKTFTQDIAIGDKHITLSVGKLAPQANASVVAQFGNTIVLATVSLGRVDEGKDYFPLSVDFIDKLYAGGFIKGSRWIKRDGMPSDDTILNGRIIDRSLRPLFPKGFKNEVQIIVTVISNDKKHDPVLPAFLAAATAVTISDIPFNGPVSAVRVASVKKQLIVAPNLKELEQSSLDLLVCTGPAGVNMIEAGANIVDNETMIKAIELAKDTGDQINKQITDFASKVAKKKIEFEISGPSPELVKEIGSKIETELSKFFKEGIDGNHMAAQQKIVDKVFELYKDKIESKEVSSGHLIEAIDIIIEEHLRQQASKGNRYDNRKMDQVRDLNIEPGFLPMTHGSVLFERGLTQAVTVTTLAPLSEKQLLQDSAGEGYKRYIHYYSAMPFSVGQTGRVGRPGRREVGHGALAEKALAPVIPSEQDFPYTILLTSEVLSQNGSSSMASTCGSTMSLMDAGVPIKDKVAGISIGLMAESDDKYILITDIAGLEDHFGDMDFKITGTKNGVTAIQLDIKRQGITIQMIKDTFIASTKARLQILEKMESVLATSRPQLSQFAPKIKLIQLPEKKIGDVIGSGGKTIKALMEKHTVQIDIDDNGAASISSQDQKAIDAAVYEIESMIKDVQIGEQYPGTVTRVENYGAFVEFLPTREALLHISELSGGFLSDPSTIIKVGDKIDVTISGFNDNHQIKLSAPEFKAAHPGQANNQPKDRVSFSKPRTSFNKFNPNLSSKPKRRTR